MTEPWRRLTLAAALIVMIGAGVANAQTVIVAKAPPASQVAITLNGRAIGSATADGNGQAIVDVGKSPNAGKIDTDVHVYVDACGTERRVQLVERGLEPPALADGCTRQEIAGWFVFRQPTTLLVDVAPPAPVVWLRQGPVPEEWLRKPAEGEPERGPKTPGRESTAPAGVSLFGGGGFVKVSSVTEHACGDVTDCSGKSFRPSLTAGVGVWVNQYIGVEASYIKPMAVTASGNGGYYRFNSELDANVVTVAGKLGVPFGPARIYGKGGATYERSLFTTTETIDTTDASGVTTTSYTYKIASKVEGWGWLFGGGIEVWVNSTIGAYVDAGRAKLNGKAIDNSEASIDSAITYVLLGVRIHLGK